MLLALARDFGRVGCRLLVDESFLGFCPDAADRSVEGETHKHPNLVVLKSLTKACGCLGLRLGYALSGDTDLVAAIRRRLPVFNVNGVAEWFLRLLPRYRTEFAAACRQVRTETDELYARLATIPWLACWPSAANFVFCRVDHPRLDGVELARRLFLDRRVLVKHCAGKALPGGERYVRIGSRTPAENAALVRALTVIGDDAAEVLSPDPETELAGAGR
jgi:histidinol-phosphate/aromatic aminotransferase/cobyric acid decarboxylase-like protein